MAKVGTLEACLRDLTVTRGFPEHLVAVAKEKVESRTFDGPNVFSVKRRGLVDETLVHTGHSGDDRGLTVTTLRTLDAFEDVWLVTHTWSFSFRDALEELRANPTLRTTIAACLFRDEAVITPAEVVFENLWRVAWPIAAKNAKGDTLWVVLDDLGCGLTHSFTPNGRIASIVFEGGVVSLLWITEPCASGTEITIDRSPAVPAHNDPSDGVVGRILYGDDTDKNDAMRLCETNLNLRDGRVSAAPLVDLAVPCPVEPVYEPLNSRKPLKVCTDSRLVQECLTDRKHFTIVTDADDADVMWLCHYRMHSSDEFPNARFVSQIPEERHFVNKGALARTIQRGYGYRTWHPDTFECPEQLPAFIAAFARRQLRVDAGVKDGQGVDDEIEEHNLWIVKVPDLTRGIDMCISDNLPWLIRIASECGKRIVQAYISRPLLFRKRKFDVRYYLMIRSVQPLEAYVYKTFVVRLAGEEYDPSEFHRFDRHWTVSREAGQGTFPNEEFIAEFESSLPSSGATMGVWRRQMEPRIVNLLRELCLAIQPMVNNSIPRDRFRGLYAADIIFTSGLQPRLLEMNYSPDNTKILSIAPNFTNDVFSTLFLGHPVNTIKL